MGYWLNTRGNQPGGTLLGARYGTRSACEAAQAATGSIVYPDQCQYQEDVQPCSPLQKQYRGYSYTLNCDGTVEGQARDIFSNESDFFWYVDRGGYEPFEEDTPTMCSMFGINCPTTEPPVKPPIKESEACPKGDRYYPTFWEKLTGCEDGYTMRVDEFPTGRPYCLCQRAGGDEGEEDWGLGLDTLGGIMKMLPQLLIVMVIVSIIGAFRK